MLEEITFYELQNVEVNNNSIYPTNAHSLLCKILHRFANMFRSRGIIIRATYTMNIGMLLYTIHIRSYTVCGYVTSVLCVLGIGFYTC